MLCQLSEFQIVPIVKKCHLMNNKGNTGSLSFIVVLQLLNFSSHIKINLQQLIKDDKSYQPRSTATILLKSDDLSNFSASESVFCHEI